MPFYDQTYGHTIKKVDAFEEDLDLLFNKVIVQYGDTITSASIKEQSWQMGDSTTSWKYGVRPLKIENDWLNSTNAEKIASQTFADFNVVKERVELNCKYIPTLNLLEKTEVRLDLDAEGGTRWDRFDWDDGNWDGSKGTIYSFGGKEFKIMGLEHNLDRFDTNIILRRI